MNNAQKIIHIIHISFIINILIKESRLFVFDAELAVDGS